MILSHRSRRVSNLRKKSPDGHCLTGAFLYWNQWAGLFGHKGIESLGFRGHLTLDFPSGAGANGSRTIGTGVVGGMLIGTIGLLIIVPTLFVVFQTLQEKFKPVVFKESADPMIIEEINKIALLKQQKENTKKE